MQVTQASILQSLRAVRSFLDENATRLRDIGSTGARKRLDDAVTELASHAAIQSGSFLQAKGSTKEQKALRKLLLRDHMAPIARIAAADLTGTPNIEPLRMPKSRQMGERLAAAAKGMGETAAKFAPIFVAAGRPTDFVERLNAATDAMLATLSQRSDSRRYRIGATKGLKTKLSAARKIVAVLDSFVQGPLEDDPVLLAQWNSIKRVQGIPGGRAVSPPASPVAPVTPGTPDSTSATTLSHSS